MPQSKFKTDKNLGQVRLLMFQASKKAPLSPLQNPGYATAQATGKLQLSNTLRVGPWKIFKMKMGHG